MYDRLLTGGDLNLDTVLEDDFVVPPRLRKNERDLPLSKLRCELMRESRIEEMASRAVNLYIRGYVHEVSTTEQCVYLIGWMFSADFWASPQLDVKRIGGRIVYTVPIASQNARPMAKLGSHLHRRSH